MRSPGVVLALALASLAAPTTAAAGPGDPISGGTTSPAEAAARATLARWQAAQNTGDFDGYAALYAPAFAGVKRVGKTTKKMNRAAWLKDRKAMFKAPMSVGTADVKVTLAPAGPVLELTQTWSSGAFADTGQKRMTFSADGLSIVAEEMLSSRVMLTRGACLSALYPGSSLKKMRTGEDDGERTVSAIEVIDLGGRWACKVEVARDGGFDATVGVLAFGKKWEAKGTVDAGYESSQDPDNAIDVSGEVTVVAAPLHDKVPVLQVTVFGRRDEPGSSTTESKTTLYRADGDELVELISYGSGGSGGETDESTSCDLDVAERRVKGWPDLTLTCTKRTSYYHGEDPAETEEQEVTKYRWDGSSYAER